MRHFVLLLLVFAGFLLPNARSIGSYKAGDQLYVWAMRGLNLRATPDAKGKKLALLPFSTEVTVQGESLKKLRYETLEIPGYTLKGYWVKVKVDGQVGFIFDAYLSKMRPWTGTELEESQSMTELITASFGPTLSKTVDPTQDGVVEAYTVTYAQEASAAYSQYEGGLTVKMVLPKGATLEEAYLMGRYLLRDEKQECKSEQKGAVLLCTAEGGFTQITAQIENGRAVLEFAVAD